MGWQGVLEHRIQLAACIESCYGWSLGAGDGYWKIWLQCVYEGEKGDLF